MKQPIVFSPERSGSSVIVTQQNGVCVLSLMGCESVTDRAHETALRLERRRQDQLSALRDRFPGSFWLIGGGEVANG